MAMKGSASKRNDDARNSQASMRTEIISQAKIIAGKI